MPTETTSVKAYRINIKNPVYCKLLTDDKSGVTYGEVKELSEAMTVQVTPTQATGVLYGNGAQSDNSAKLTGITMKLDGTKIDIEDRAEIQGHEYTNGVLIKKEGDQAPYIAVGYMVEETQEKDEYVWLLKGRSQEAASSVQQATDKINYSTDSITVNFIKRAYDGHFQYEADSANPAFTEAQAAKWFTSGPVTPPTASTGQ